MNVLTDDLKEIADQTIEESYRFGNKTILLLGGSGFLGTLFRKFFVYLNETRLKNLPCKIISIDNYIKGTTTLEAETEHPNVTYINHDLSYPLDLKLASFNKIHYVLNCSGNAAPQNYLQYPVETLLVSSIALYHLLLIAHSYQARILNFSSSEVLGTPPDDEIPTPETSISRIETENPRLPYDAGKLFIEALSWSFRTKYNVNSVIVRPFNCVGNFHPKDYRVIPNMLNCLFQDKPIHIYKPGTQTRTFVYFTDFIVGVLKVLINGKDHVYHIGNSDNEISMLSLGKMMARIAGKPEMVELVDTPFVYKTEPKRRCPSIEKARQELGYNPKVGLEEMLTRIYNFAKEQYNYD